MPLLPALPAAQVVASASAMTPPALVQSHLRTGVGPRTGPGPRTNVGPWTGAGPIPAPLSVIASVAQLPTVRRDERMRLSRDARDANVGSTAAFDGALLPRLAHRRVTLMLLFGRRWRTVASTFTGARGRFKLRYHSRSAGSWDAQVRFAGGPYATGVTRRVGQLNFFRPALASWYGGGGGMACGGQLTSSTLGVANRTLPCGTWVTLRYGSRSVRVQVVDRGPYVAGREFDLTEATKRALGFEGVGTVWTTS